MRSFVRLLTIALTLFLPRISTASTLEVTIVEPMGINFGPSGADFFSSGFDGLFLDGVFQETPWFSGFAGGLELESGALLSLTLTDFGDGRIGSSYEYRPGTATLTVVWQDALGNQEEGAFVAPLLGLRVDIACEAELSTEICGNPHGFSSGTAFALFGPGLFDPVLAALLGILPAGDPLEFEVRLDEITGNPSSALRVSGSSGGQEKFSIGVEVPEPPALSLLLLSLSSLAAFRSHRLRTRRRL
jgi:hypothetical protein